MWPDRGWWRGLAQFAGFCFVVTVCLLAVFVLPNGWRGWRWFGINFAIAYLYSFEIGAIATFVTPAVARRVWHWPPFNRWSILIVALVGVAIVGTFIGTAALQLFWFGRFGPTFWQSLRVSVPITLIVGVLVTVIESSRERLQAAELSLRTQQLERERAEKLAAEARLASLTSRVQPHFLFNTLNTIAALVRDDPRQAEQTIEQLSGLLRSSLDPADAIPLDREMKLVADYLEIQRTRLGNRLRFAIDWEPASLGGATIPPFAIQTLVENALKHVAGQRQDGVTLQVRLRRAEADVVVEVTDDGAGFSPGAIASGHGLDNLQARLRALYGSRARLEFDRAAGAMTVRLRVPR
jgi:two-component system sensor histidine kinase AlgZ